MRLTIALLAATPLFAQETADSIMAKVGENQTRVIKLLSDYAYQEHIRVETRHFNGKLARKEIGDYAMAPGSENKVEKLEGQYWNKKTKQYVDFNAKEPPNKGSLDAGLIDGFRQDLLKSSNKPASKPDAKKSGANNSDEDSGDLFPLAAGQLKKYKFTLLGEIEVQGRRTYRIRFVPAKKNDIDWAGEALIDAEEFQPVNVYTKLSRRIPFAIRTLLGTDLPGIGYNVKYERLEKDVWFPVSYGAEFRLHVLFFINRDISISADASGYKRVTPPQASASAPSPSRSEAVSPLP